MHGSQINLLQTLITAANNWRASATGQGVSLTQINVVFPDGKPVTLFFDSEANDWLVDT